MENLKQELVRLIKRNEELKPDIFKSFNTVEELKKYKEKNKVVFDEYFDNQEKIQTLEWDLMTPEEKERKLEVAKKIRAKTSGNQNQ